MDNFDDVVLMTWIPFSFWRCQNNLYNALGLLFLM